MVGAATSKLNHHFPYVVSVMTSNNALLRSKLFNWFKHLLYLDPVDDLRPSWLPKLMAHVGGTTAEFLVPGSWSSSPTVTNGGGSSSVSW